MNVYIIFDIKNTPTGGGNQFLKALRNYFVKTDNYTENPDEADIFLFNSYQYIPEVIKLKKKYPEKLFVHRIDGPIRLYSKMSDKRDAIINTVNKYIADATVFQSKWSKQANLSLGLKKTSFCTIITNAPDSRIFNKKDKKEFNPEKKIKLIATSWSSQLKKGFEVYKYLDKNLDFSRYEMTFCGNSPFKFKNIKQIKPLPSNELAKQLKNNDIFITASQKDPCSNSLIEALHCGLPAIALNEGGHPEIIKDAGEFFENPEEIPDLLQKISKNYNEYIKKITVSNIDTAAEQYISFFKDLLNSKNNKSKKLNFFFEIIIKFTIFNQKLKSKIKNFKKN